MFFFVARAVKSAQNSGPHQVSKPPKARLFDICQSLNSELDWEEGDFWKKNVNQEGGGGNQVAACNNKLQTEKPKQSTWIQPT